MRCSMRVRSKDVLWDEELADNILTHTGGSEFLELVVGSNIELEERVDKAKDDAKPIQLSNHGGTYSISFVFASNAKQRTILLCCSESIPIKQKATAKATCAAQYTEEIICRLIHNKLPIIAPSSSSLSIIHFPSFLVYRQQIKKETCSCQGANKQRSICRCRCIRLAWEASGVQLYIWGLIHHDVNNVDGHEVVIMLLLTGTMAWYSTNESLSCRGSPLPSVMHPLRTFSSSATTHRLFDNNDRASLRTSLHRVQSLHHSPPPFVPPSTFLCRTIAKHFHRNAKPLLDELTVQLRDPPTSALGGEPMESDGERSVEPVSALFCVVRRTVNF
ncbi:uncharacterized protein LOC104584873 [Brachypodium distachyon]|uniref:uncharacterized protein LOC104584873 n=1 Tax=Brachypodium distachyon TaxID=15368 RepID=UPI000D0D1D7A|nr:uncharacterized protein LOC104584873 [Brachypodium distachyon]|eukprot:XP_024310274.1 uncharacterized protein LOC104584873 [Brachypodium distachyon]